MDCHEILPEKTSYPGKCIDVRAGHGGIEAFLILGMSSMSNLLTAAMINGGLMEKTMTALEPAQQEVTYHQLSVLWTTPAYQFYLAPMERISAIALQIAVVDSCIQCGEDRQKVAFGSSLRTAFCSGLSDCGVCLHDSYMGIGAGIADGGCSDLCSGIQAGLCIVDREKGLTETKTIR